MIEPPKTHPRRRAFRAVVEALAQLFPPTSFLARIFQATHPSPEESDRERWEGEATSAINQLTASTRRKIEHMEVVGGFRDGPRGFWAKSGISSVTDAGIGLFSVGFMSPMADEDYHVSLTLSSGRGFVTAQTRHGFSMRLVDDAGRPAEPAHVTFAIRA